MCSIAATKRSLNVDELIDNNPVGLFRWILFVLGFLAVLLDGYDSAIMSFVAPKLSQEWGLDVQTMGLILSAGFVGQALGAIGGGALADRLGRRPMVLATVFGFGIMTLATAVAPHVTLIIAARMIAGAFLGAAIANVAALVAEYAPRRIRSFMTTLVLGGIGFGATTGGMLSAWLIPAFGWKSVIVVGGILPVVLAFISLFGVPESLKFMLLHKRGDASTVESIARKIAHNLRSDENGLVLIYKASKSEQPQVSSIRLVTAPAYRSSTIALWVTYFCVLFLIYILVSWLPTLIMKQSGYDMSKSALVASMYHLGGPIGSICIGWAMDRWNKKGVLITALVVAAITLVLIGQLAQQSSVLLGACAFLVGFCIIGESIGLVAFSASFYPTAARATGTGCMMMAGRIGASLSALAGAALVLLGWPMSQLFLALIVPALIAAACLSVVRPVNWSAPELILRQQ